MWCRNPIPSPNFVYQMQTKLALSEASQPSYHDIRLFVIRFAPASDEVGQPLQHLITTNEVVARGAWDEKVSSLGICSSCQMLSTFGCGAVLHCESRWIPRRTLLLSSCMPRSPKPCETLEYAFLPAIATCEIVEKIRQKGCYNEADQVLWELIYACEAVVMCSL